MRSRRLSCHGPGSPPEFWFAFWIETVFLGAILLLTLLALLKSDQWSFGDALSEEADPQPDPAPPKPLMVASSSRLIAFLGLLVILANYVGTGHYIQYRLFTTGVMPEVKELTAFLYGGAVIFAPYLANQLKEAFSAFAKK